MFLAADGIYALTGGTSGGAVLDLLKLTDGFEDEIARITPDCTAACRSVYSARQREYQLYVPLDGSDRPSAAFVMHLDKLQRSPDVSPWTVRTGFPVGSIDVRNTGEIIFGHHTGTQSSDPDAQRGLFVLSARRALGGQILSDVWTPAAPPVASFRSAWTDFGDASILKDVIGVVLHVMSTGDPQITLQWYTDYSDTPTSERTYRQQPADKTSLPVYDTVTLDSGAVYSRERLTDLRYAVAVKGCTQFSFGFTTQSDVILVGWSYVYEVSGKPITRGKRA